MGVMKAYEYPTDEQLKTISEWDVLVGPVTDLLNYVKSLWWMPDWGFHFEGHQSRGLRLELHTGGWSGNEDIIKALQNNFIFWNMNWVKSTRGGHYWFKIRKLAGS